MSIRSLTDFISNNEFFIRKNWNQNVYIKFRVLKFFVTKKNHKFAP